MVGLRHVSCVAVLRTALRRQRLRREMRSRRSEMRSRRGEIRSRRSEVHAGSVGASMLHEHEHADAFHYNGGGVPLGDVLFGR